MSEANTIAKTKEPNTIESIRDGLKRLGIEHGDILLVHSSMSSLGWVCGGPQTVVMALLDAVGSDGTLVMPSHSGDWSDPAQWQNPPVPKEWVSIIYDSMPAFDPKLTPTRGMGRIAELFRTFPGTIRSNHPQVSFSANGKHAADITESHPLTPQFGMDSPLGKLYLLNAKILLLGVGYGNCTSFHLAEALTPGMSTRIQGTAMLENGKRVWKWFEDVDFTADDFDLMGEDFEKIHTVQKGSIGNTTSRVFRIRDAVDFAREWLPKHRLEQHIK